MKELEQVIFWAGSLVTIFVFVVYLCSVYKRKAQIKLRFFETRDKKCVVFGQQGQICFGVSSLKKFDLLEISLRICGSKIGLKQNNSFKTQLRNGDVYFIWSGRQSLQNSVFILYDIPFISELQADTDLNLDIMIKTEINPIDWTFPWSLFSPYPCKKIIKQKILWKKQQLEVFFRVEKHERVMLLGELSQNEIRCIYDEPQDGVVKTTELFYDGTYAANEIKLIPSPATKYTD